MKRKRPKDLVKEFQAWVDKDGSTASRQELDQFGHWLYSFAYWMEGQDLIDENSDLEEPGWACRYHVVPAHESPCPFGMGSERNELSALNTKSDMKKKEPK